MLTLYDYFRSTASYRVRIVLNLKNIPYQSKSIHLVKDGGQQYQQSYRSLNPQSMVPCLVDEQRSLPLNQSLAIIDYLEQQYPQPSIYPVDAYDKALAHSIALQICCDIHPLNNLRVLNYLKKHCQQTEDQTLNWYHHWLQVGFEAIEQKLQTLEANQFCLADTITIADICLIPQVYNAQRFNFDMSPYPIINKINKHCLSLSSFINASPERVESNG